MAKPKEPEKAQIPVKPPRETIVKPLITVKGQKHCLEELDDEDALPEIKSIGILKLSKVDEGRRSDWVSFVMTTRGREVVSLEVSEPDHKAIAEDNCKTTFVSLFMNQEGLL